MGWIQNKLARRKMSRYRVLDLPHTAAAVLLLVLHTAVLVRGQVTLSLGSTLLTNNSEVVITDIGDAATGGSPLICTTTFRPCCATHPNRHGEWFNPDGRVDTSPAGGDFYRNRGDGTVLLHRRNGPLSPTGTYYCEIPLNSADLQRLTVTVIAPPPPTTMEPTPDINECMSGGTNDCVSGATCMNTVGSFTCTCPSGHTGNGRTSGTGCTDINECTSGATNDCVTNADCMNNDDSFTCTCRSGYTGDGRTSGTGCTDINECTSVTNDCVTNADCMNTIGSFVCICRRGYTGDGRTCTDINECTSPGADDCVTNAECMNTVGSFTCTCPSGFTGDGRTSGTGCTESGVNECTSGADDCVSGATCVNTVGSFTCMCPSGFTGDGRTSPGTGCTDINECTSGANDCVTNADCMNTMGSFVCTCQSGYIGDGRTGCTDVDECTTGSVTCSSGLMCANTPGSFSCVDINECTSGADDCVTNADCINTVGSFICTCPSGLIGDGRTSGTGCTVPGSVEVIFRGVSLPNNSVLSINDVGEFSNGGAVLCTTDKRPCCGTPPNRFGEWYYPNGTAVYNVLAPTDIYRGREDNGTIHLNRRNNAQSPTGSYCCELPDSSGVTQRVCVTLAPVSLSITPQLQVDPNAGSQFQLTCTATGSTDTPTFTWLGPPSNTRLPSDTRNVSGVMSSGSTHTSILQFDPIQLLHEGMYTCQVEVDGETVMTSTQVNVEEPGTSTTTAQTTTSPQITDGTATSSSGSNIAITVLGVIVGLLVLIILVAAVVVIAVVCVLKRRGKQESSGPHTIPNMAYGPVKRGTEVHMQLSDYEEVKPPVSGNQVYEEIPEVPQPNMDIGLAPNVAYGPIQHTSASGGAAIQGHVGESEYEVV